MNINEIRASGLLELYVLDALNGSELEQVKVFLKQFPDLKSDLNSIERTLQTYAYANAITPRTDLKAQILQEARNSRNISNNNTTNNIQSSSSGNGLWMALAALLALLTAFFAYSWFSAKASANETIQKLEEKHRTENEACDSIRLESTRQYALYQDLTNPNNQIIQNAEMPKYVGTEIYFYHNPVDKKNYLQLSALPPIDNNTQSYQLWSIIGTDPPRPLNVFQSDVATIPVQHVEDTQVYAITIERKGGVQSPTLENIIGTFTI